MAKRNTSSQKKQQHQPRNGGGGAGVGVGGSNQSRFSGGAAAAANFRSGPPKKRTIREIFEDEDDVDDDNDSSSRDDDESDFLDDDDNDLFESNTTKTRDSVNKQFNRECGKNSDNKANHGTDHMEVISVRSTPSPAGSAHSHDGSSSEAPTLHSASSPPPAMLMTMMTRDVDSQPTPGAMLFFPATGAHDSAIEPTNDLDDLRTQQFTQPNSFLLEKADAVTHEHQQGHDGDPTLPVTTEKVKSAPPKSCSARKSSRRANEASPVPPTRPRNCSRSTTCTKKPSPAQHHSLFGDNSVRSINPPASMSSQASPAEIADATLNTMPQTCSTTTTTTNEDMTISALLHIRNASALQDNGCNNQQQKSARPSQVEGLEQIVHKEPPPMECVATKTNALIYPTCNVKDFLDNALSPPQATTAATKSVAAKRNVPDRRHVNIKEARPETAMQGGRVDASFKPTLKGQRGKRVAPSSLEPTDSLARVGTTTTSIDRSVTASQAANRAQSSNKKKSSSRKRRTEPASSEEQQQGISSHSKKTKTLPVESTELTAVELALALKQVEAMNAPKTSKKSNLKVVVDPREAVALSLEQSQQQSSDHADRLPCSISGSAIPSKDDEVSNPSSPAPPRATAALTKSSESETFPKESAPAAERTKPEVAWAARPKKLSATPCMPAAATKSVETAPEVEESTPVPGQNKPEVASADKPKKKKMTLQDNLVHHMRTAFKPFTLKGLTEVMKANETAIEYTMLSLIDKGIVSKKDFTSAKGGRAKTLYWANYGVQSKELAVPEPVSRSEMAVTEHKQMELREQLASLHQILQGVMELPSNQELNDQLAVKEADRSRVRRQLEETKARIHYSKQPSTGDTLLNYRGGSSGNGVDIHKKSAALLARERCPRRLKMRINAMREEWKKRKDKCVDFCETLADAMEQKPYNVMKNILQLETDEMAHVMMPPRYILD